MGEVSVWHAIGVESPDVGMGAREDTHFVGSKAHAILGDTNTAISYFCKSYPSLRAGEGFVKPWT